MIINVRSIRVECMEGDKLQSVATQQAGARSKIEQCAIIISEIRANPKMKTYLTQKNERLVSKVQRIAPIPTQ